MPTGVPFSTPSDALEIREGDVAPVVGGLAFPVERDLGAVAGLDVPVDAVVRRVELAADEPLRVRQVPFADGLERLEPRDTLARLRLPELVEAPVVDLGRRVRLGGELPGRRIPPLLEEHRVDRVVRSLSGHPLPPSAWASVNPARSYGGSAPERRANGSTCRTGDMLNSRPV
jgi:hypothetical protein